MASDSQVFRLLKKNNMYGVFHFKKIYIRVALLCLNYVEVVKTLSQI